MHDMNGSMIEVGDIVLIPCRVEYLCDATEDFCNIGLETTKGRKPDGKKEYFASVNTAQVVLLSRANGA